MLKQYTHLRFAVCINDGGYIDDLKVRTVYRVLPDESAAKSNYLRIIDETGEDYLYPAAYFVLIEVSPEAEEILLLTLQGSEATPA
ncbi:MAG: hypothetical protein DPW09_22495 [Anaerolineae bacterium]|nr:hypothetical protein [Anaerolineae bacterium]